MRSLPKPKRRDPRPSSEGATKVLLRLAPGLHASVFLCAQRSGRSFTAEVVEALKTYVASRKSEIGS